MKKYLSLIKFSHTIFSMPFALIGFFLAIQYSNFDWKILLYIILCMIFGRSSAMAFNRYIDRDIDKKNIRTAKSREIPKGNIKPKDALLFVIINSLLFIATTYLINNICFYLSPIALIIILGYSYTKRFTSYCHLILGLSLALSPIGAYLAVSGTFHITPIIFSLIVLCWVSGFDIIYSLQDEEFDRKNKLYSFPVSLGTRNALILSKILHIITSIIIIALAIINNLGLYYWIGSLIFIMLLIYQHTIISINNLSRINLAFFTTNGIASVIFGTFVIIEILSQ